MVGTGSRTAGREGFLVFVMRVAEILSFDEYWADPRFQRKKPNLRGSKKQAFGDNVYHRASARASWKQEDSHHSFADGQPNPANIANDTQSPRVLIGTEYAYWGGQGPQVPPRFRDFDGYDLCAGRGHRNRFPPEFVAAFMTWFKSLGEQGRIGVPLDWPRSP